jgi:hypothetical protein
MSFYNGLKLLKKTEILNRYEDFVQKLRLLLRIFITYPLK